MCVVHAPAPTVLAAVTHHSLSHTDEPSWPKKCQSVVWLLYGSGNARLCVCQGGPQLSVLVYCSLPLQLQRSTLCLDLAQLCLHLMMLRKANGSGGKCNVHE